MTQNQFPSGWDEQKVKRVIAHYEEQTDEEAVMEDESAWESSEATMMQIPLDLVPVVRELIAKQQSSLNS